jgi:hypothetical protein
MRNYFFAPNRGYTVSTNTNLTTLLSYFTSGIIKQTSLSNISVDKEGIQTNRLPSHCLRGDGEWANINDQISTVSAGININSFPGTLNISKIQTGSDGFLYCNSFLGIIYRGLLDTNIPTLTVSKISDYTSSTHTLINATKLTSLTGNLPISRIKQLELLILLHI